MTPKPFCCDIRCGTIEKQQEFKWLFEKASKQEWHFKNRHYGYDLTGRFSCWRHRENALIHCASIIPISEGISILKQMVGEEEKKDKLIEITFGSHLKCLVRIVNNTIEVMEAMNGWGDNVPQDEIKVQPKP